MRTKSCTNENCKQQNPQSLDNFYINKNTRDGFFSICKICKNEQDRKYYEKNKEKINKKTKQYREENIEYIREYRNNPEFKQRQKVTDRERRLLRSYNLSLEQYNKMLMAQNHKCKVCGIDEIEAGKYGLVIDHNHKTGEVRSLLCSTCNTILGTLEEKKELVSKLYQYLDSFSSFSNVVNFKKEKI